VGNACVSLAPLPLSLKVSAGILGSIVVMASSSQKTNRPGVSMLLPAVRKTSSDTKLGLVMASAANHQTIIKSVNLLHNKTIAGRT